MAKRQRKETACENVARENPQTKVRTSGEKTQPNLHGAGSRGGGWGDKSRKGGSQDGLRPFLWGRPSLRP